MFRPTRTHEVTRPSRAGSRRRHVRRPAARNLRSTNATAPPRHRRPPMVYNCPNSEGPARYAGSLALDILAPLPTSILSSSSISLSDENGHKPHDIHGELLGCRQGPTPARANSTAGLLSQSARVGSPRAQQHGGVRFCMAPRQQPGRSSTVACAFVRGHGKLHFVTTVLLSCCTPTIVLCNVTLHCCCTIILLCYYYAV